MSRLFVALSAACLAVSSAASISGASVPLGGFDFDCYRHQLLSPASSFDTPVSAEVYAFLNDTSFSDCYYGIDPSRIKGKIVLISDWQLAEGILQYHCPGFIPLHTYGGVTAAASTGLTYEAMKNLEDMGAVGVVVWMWGNVEKTALTSAAFGDFRETNLPICITSFDCWYDEYTCCPKNDCYQGDHLRYIQNVTAGRLWFTENSFFPQTDCPTDIPPPLPAGVTITMSDTPLVYSSVVNSTASRVFFVIYAVLSFVLVLVSLHTLYILCKTSFGDKFLTCLVVILEGIVTSVLKGYRCISLQPLYFIPGGSMFLTDVFSYTDVASSACSTLIASYLWFKICFAVALRNCSKFVMSLLDMVVAAVTLGLMGFLLYWANYLGEYTLTGDDQISLQYTYVPSAVLYTGYGLFALIFVVAIFKIFAASKASDSSGAVAVIKKWSRYILIQIVFGIANTYLQQMQKSEQYLKQFASGPILLNSLYHASEITSIVTAYAQIFMMRLKSSSSSSSSSSVL